VNGTALTALHESAGARLAADARTVLTYGDVPAEYRAATESAVVFDATDRDALEVSGAEAGVFLNRLLANDVKQLASARSQRNLLLSAKGKILFDFEVARVGERYLLSLPPGTGAALWKALDTYLFAEKVRLTDVGAGHAPIEIAGPRAADVVRDAVGVDVARDEHGVPIERAVAQGTFADGPITIIELPVAGSPGFRVDAGPERASVLWRALIAAGARPAGVVVRDILRVEAGVASPGVDVDENVYPQEARAEAGFRLDKGCYIGQEVVAKIDTYGGLNKRLVCLKISHDDPIARGTRLCRLDDGEWRDLGVVTSWAYSFVLDTGLVLAYVKRRHQKVGTEFRVGDGPATAVIVPMPVRSGAVPPTGEFE